MRRERSVALPWGQSLPWSAALAFDLERRSSGVRLAARPWLVPVLAVRSGRRAVGMCLQIDEAHDERSRAEQSRSWPVGQTLLRHLAAGEARPHPYRVRLTPWPATDYDVDAGTGFHPNPSTRALRHDPAALTSARERVTDSAEAAMGGTERTPRPQERLPE